MLQRTGSRVNVFMNNVQYHFLPFIFGLNSEKERLTKSTPSTPLLCDRTTYDSRAFISPFLFVRPSDFVSSLLVQRVTAELSFHRTTSTFLSNLFSSAFLVFFFQIRLTGDVALFILFYVTHQCQESPFP